MPMFRRSMLVILSVAVLMIVGTALAITGKDEAAELEIPKEKVPVATVTVYVSGAVNKPGVVTLQAGERVVSAVKKCGDVLPTADINAVNMAAELTDGMQIIIPELTAVGGNSVVGKVSSAVDKVNINRANEQELDRLPGIGPAMAKRIVDYRTEKGKFESIDDLKKVRGIGAAKFEKLRDKIRT